MTEEPPPPVKLFGLDDSIHNHPTVQALLRSHRRLVVILIIVALCAAGRAAGQ